MEIGTIITGCFTGLIAILFGIYVFFTARNRGPIFSNTYILLTKEERKKADKKAEYKLVTVVFGCLSVTFGLLTVNILTSWTWAYILMWISIGFVIIYAIVNSIKTYH